ncbi:alcohol acetyltransferase-domain-containing protein [Phaeosphaeriaceae sp. PMI808]|nr:alcohol acetyltransferase-domain-containing protein [Phaeosphaeriaceae sp. PMI808]
MLGSDRGEKLQGNGGNQNIIRPLGHNELYQLARYTLGQYRGTSVICRYVVPKHLATQSAPTQLAATVHTAIARVISECPTLQVGISGENSRKPVWISLGGVELTQHVEWISLDDSMDIERFTQQTIEAQLDAKFFELDARPGWRIIILQHSQNDLLDILFTWNHPHGDGMSGKIFHQKLHESLNAVAPEAAQKDFENLTIELSDSASKFPPTTEQQVKPSISPTFILREAWNDNKPTSLFPNPSQANWAPIRTSPYKTRFLVRSINNGILSKALTACRQHQTTLTALLNVLALISLSSNLEEKKASAFASSTAIDQRRFLPSRPAKYPWLDPKTTIANYVSIMYHEFDRALVAQIRSVIAMADNKASPSDDLSDLIWSTATRVRKEIEKRLEMEFHDDSVGLMKFVPDWRVQFRKDVKKPRKLSWFITNLGVLDGQAKTSSPQGNDSEEAWAIRRAQFTISTEIPVAALLITAMSVKDAELVLTCTWQDTVVEPSLVEHLMTDIENLLNHIGAHSS